MSSTLAAWFDTSIPLSSGPCGTAARRSVRSRTWAAHRRGGPANGLGRAARPGGGSAPRDRPAAARDAAPIPPADPLHQSGAGCAPRGHQRACRARDPGRGDRARHRASPGHGARGTLPGPRRYDALLCRAVLHTGDRAPAAGAVVAHPGFRQTGSASPHCLAREPAARAAATARSRHGAIHRQAEAVAIAAPPLRPPVLVAAELEPLLGPDDLVG